MRPRYFLVAPKALSASDVCACVKAAVSVGDCASLIVHENVKVDDIAAVQALGCAVFLADAEPRLVAYLKADGLHVSKPDENLLELRGSLPKNTMIGFDCGTSRHAAMQAAEQGADYVGFHQKAQTGGEPLVKWWNDLAATPAVPLDASTLEDAAILAQQSDFIRPADEMWQNPQAALKIITELNEKLK